MSKQADTNAPMIVIPPYGVYSGLTAGKEYKIIDFYEPWDVRVGYQFTIIDDFGFNLFCFEKGCQHIDYNNWIIKESEEIYE